MSLPTKLQDIHTASYNPASHLELTGFCIVRVTTEYKVSLFEGEGSPRLELFH